MAKSRYADATKAARRAAMSAHKVTATDSDAVAAAQPTASAVAEPARDARRDELTHVDAKGEVRMVDVSDKAETHRIAIAEGTILMHPETQAMVLQDRAKRVTCLPARAWRASWPSNARATSFPCAIRCSLPRASAISSPSLRRERRPGRARGLGAGAHRRAGWLSRAGYGRRDGQDRH